MSRNTLPILACSMLCCIARAYCGKANTLVREGKLLARVARRSHRRAQRRHALVSRETVRGERETHSSQKLPASFQGQLAPISHNGCISCVSSVTANYLMD